MVNSLAYCAQAVLEQAQFMAGNAPPPADAKTPAPPFELDELARLPRMRTLSNSGKPAFEEIAAALERLAAEAESQYRDLEDLERRLTVLEEKMIAIARGDADRRRRAGRAPRARPPTAPLPRQNDRRSDRDAGKAVPRPPPARIRRPAPAEPVLFALILVAYPNCPTG